MVLAGIASCIAFGGAQQGDAGPALPQRLAKLPAGCQARFPLAYQS